MTRPNPDDPPILERLRRWLLAPVLDRLTILEDRMTSADQTFDQAMTRFAQVQSDGFGAVRTRLAELVAAAQASGDDATMRAAARVDAGVDALSGGFAEFAAAAPIEVPTDSIPPVINPETPPVTDTDPSATEGLPVDAEAVVADPSIPTPADEG